MLGFFGKKDDASKPPSGNSEQAARPVSLDIPRIQQGVQPEVRQSLDVNHRASLAPEAPKRKSIFEAIREKDPVLKAVTSFMNITTYPPHLFLYKGQDVMGNTVAILVSHDGLLIAEPTSKKVIKSFYFHEISGWLASSGRFYFEAVKGESSFKFEFFTADPNRICSGLDHAAARQFERHVIAAVRIQRICRGMLERQRVRKLKEEASKPKSNRNSIAGPVDLGAITPDTFGFNEEGQFDFTNGFSSGFLDPAGENRQDPATPNGDDIYTTPRSSIRRGPSRSISGRTRGESMVMGPARAMRQASDEVRGLWDETGAPKSQLSAVADRIYHIMWGERAILTDVFLQYAAPSDVSLSEFLEPPQRDWEWAVRTRATLSADNFSNLMEEYGIMGNLVSPDHLADIVVDVCPEAVDSGMTFPDLLVCFCLVARLAFESELGLNDNLSAVVERIIRHIRERLPENHEHRGAPSVAKRASISAPNLEPMIAEEGYSNGGIGVADHNIDMADDVVAQYYAKVLQAGFRGYAGRRKSRAIRERQARLFPEAISEEDSRPSNAPPPESPVVTTPASQPEVARDKPGRVVTFESPPAAGSQESAKSVREEATEFVNHARTILGNGAGSGSVEHSGSAPVGDLIKRFNTSTPAKLPRSQMYNSRAQDEMNATVVFGDQVRQEAAIKIQRVLRASLNRVRSRRYREMLVSKLQDQRAHDAATDPNQRSAIVKGLAKGKRAEIPSDPGFTCGSSEELAAMGLRVVFRGYAIRTRHYSWVLFDQYSRSKEAVKGEPIMGIEGWRSMVQRLGLRVEDADSDNQFLSNGFSFNESGSPDINEVFLTESLFHQALEAILSVCFPSMPPQQALQKVYPVNTILPPSYNDGAVLIMEKKLVLFFIKHQGFLRQVFTKYCNDGASAGSSWSEITHSDAAMSTKNFVQMARDFDITPALVGATDVISAYACTRYVPTFGFAQLLEGLARVAVIAFGEDAAGSEGDGETSLVDSVRSLLLRMTKSDGYFALDETSDAYAAQVPSPRTPENSVPAMAASVPAASPASVPAASPSAQGSAASSVLIDKVVRPANLLVRLIEGRGLTPTGALMTSMAAEDARANPFCEFYVTAMDEDPDFIDRSRKVRSRMKEAVRNPRWKEEFIFQHVSKDSLLHVVVYDKKSYWESEEIGRSQVPLSELRWSADDEFEGWFAANKGSWTFEPVASDVVEDESLLPLVHIHMTISPEVEEAENDLDSSVDIDEMPKSRKPVPPTPFIKKQREASPATSTSAASTPRGAAPRRRINTPSPTPSPRPKETPKTIRGSSDWREYTDAGTGRVYWANMKTRETTWKSPFAGAMSTSSALDQSGTSLSSPRSGRTVPNNKDWRETTDPVTGRLYYYNKVTKEVSWKPPPPAEVETDTVSGGDGLFKRSSPSRDSPNKPGHRGRGLNNTFSSYSSTMELAMINDGQYEEYPKRAKHPDIPRLPLGTPPLPSPRVGASPPPSGRQSISWRERSWSPEGRSAGHGMVSPGRKRSGYQSEEEKKEKMRETRKGIVSHLRENMSAIRAAHNEKARVRKEQIERRKKAVENVKEKQKRIGEGIRRRQQRSRSRGRDEGESASAATTPRKTPRSARSVPGKSPHSTPRAARPSPSGASVTSQSAAFNGADAFKNDWHSLADDEYM